VVTAINVACESGYSNEVIYKPKGGKK